MADAKQPDAYVPGAASAYLRGMGAPAPWAEVRANGCCGARTSKAAQPGLPDFIGRQGAHSLLDQCLAPNPLRFGPMAGPSLAATHAFSASRNSGCPERRARQWPVHEANSVGKLKIGDRWRRVVFESGAALVAWLACPLCNPW